MKNVIAVLKFGAPYLKLYWGRLVAGLLLGILFGASNAGILGTSKLLLNRVFPESAGMTQESTPQSQGMASKVRVAGENA